MPLITMQDIQGQIEGLYQYIKNRKYETKEEESNFLSDLERCMADFSQVNQVVNNEGMRCIALNNFFKKHKENLTYFQSLKDASDCDLLYTISTFLRQMTSLNLSHDGLCRVTAADFTQTVNALDWVTSLNLSHNHLYKNSGAELAQVFGDLRSVTALDLSNNHLGLHPDSGVALAQAFRALKSVTALNLSNNALCDLYPRSELVQAFSGLRSVISLNLSNNDLGHIFGDVLAQAFSALKSVTALNLSNNRLGNRSGADLAVAFSGLSVTTLNLSNNRLGSKPLASLTQALGTLPAVITCLDLSDNQLDRVGSIQEVGDLLLQTGKIIRLGNSLFEKNLATYISSTPMLQLAFGIELGPIPGTPGTNLYRFFGSTGGANHNPLGDVRALDVVREFLSSSHVNK